MDSRVLSQVLPVLRHVRPTSRRAPDAGTVPRTTGLTETERATCASDEASANLPPLVLHLTRQSATTRKKAGRMLQVRRVRRVDRDAYDSNSDRAPGVR